MLQIAPPEVAAGDKLVRNQALIDLLQLEQSRLAAELAASCQWDEEGFNSAYDWIRINCRVPGNVAGDYLTVGAHLPELEQSVRTMLAGEIGFAHLAVMARTADVVGKAFDETGLLKLARENSPGKFYYQSLHYRHSVNSKKYAEQQAEQAETNFLHMNRREDGSFFLLGCLDPVGGAVVRSALEPLARPSGGGDYRLRPQRMADALVELAAHNTRIQMQVTSSIQTLLDLTGAPGAENEFSLPISAKTVERWACDCSVTRILMQDSVVIDVGRAERTIRGPKRRALIARDQHCQWPGCDRPASWCDGHHIVYWTRGGGDELENLVLLCARHHRNVHEGGWQLIQKEDGQIVTIAPTVTFGLPRGPD